MKTYKITWNQNVCRRSDKKDFYAELPANNIEDCKDKIRKYLKLNPFLCLH